MIQKSVKYLNDWMLIPMSKYCKKKHLKEASEFSAIENKAQIEVVGNYSESPSQNEQVMHDDNITE